MTHKSAVHLFLIRENKILLLRRHNTGCHDGEYSVPARSPEGDETESEAVVRKAEEEIGVRIEDGNIRFASALLLNKNSESMDVFVRILKWEGEPFNAKPDKYDELRWVSMDDLPDNIIPYMRRAIENYLNGKLFDEFEASTSSE